VIRPAATAAFALLLAACASSGPKEGEDVLPKDYRNDIKVLLQLTLDDPTNLREAGVTEPRIDPSAPIKRYYSCVKYNARELTTKRYKGLVEKIAVFHEGNLNQMIDPPPGMCAGAAYRPFPEIEKMCLGNKCD